MTHFLFIYDFFQDGYHDILAEVRELQDQGVWTKERRESLAKYEVSTYHACKHNFPRMDIGYWAGRIAALKSRQTASFSEKVRQAEETRDLIVYRPLSGTKTSLCSFFDCGAKALWGICFYGDSKPLVLLCDPCRQEWMRAETAYTTPDGWDWDEDEDLLPMVYSGKIKPVEIGQDVVEIGKTVLPFTAMMSLGLFNMLDPAAHITLLHVLIAYVLVRWQSENIVRALFLSCDKDEKKLLDTPRWKCTLGHENSLHEHFCDECGELREVSL